MKKIKLGDKPPRDMGEIRRKLDLWAGLRVYRIFGFAFAIGGVVVAGSSLLPPYEPGLIAVRVIGGVLFFGGFAALLLRNARRTYESRVHALQDGVMVAATVTAHARKFVFWKSERDFVVVVGFEYDGARGSARIQSPRAELHEQLPLGGTVSGLFDPSSGKSLFLESMGYTVHEE